MRQKVVMTSHYRPEIIQSAFVSFIESRLSAFWSLTTPKLRLAARRQLSDELVALTFVTNRAFRRQAFDLREDWQGGQHLSLSTPIEGVYYQRHYSLVGFFDQPIALQKTIFDDKNHNWVNKSTVTIAIKPQGLVSNYLTQQAPIGCIFDTGIPSGDFTLESGQLLSSRQKSTMSLSASSPLLFIASGSGITPMPGLITQALKQKRSVTLLYYHHSSLANTPFLRYWQHLSASYDTFTYYIVSTNEPDSYLAGSRYLTSESLLALNLSLAHTVVYACGSQSLLVSLYQAAKNIRLENDSSLKDSIIVESFGTIGSTLQNDNASVDIEPQTVYLRGRQQQFTSDTTLLLSAEQAGLRLPYGCRQGLCQLCRCQKISGVVKNIQTGQISTNGFESIQTCINVALTDVVLER